MINVKSERGISIATGQIVNDVFYFVSYSNPGLFAKRMDGTSEICIGKLDCLENEKLYYDSVLYKGKIFFIPNLGNNRLMIYDTTISKIGYYYIELRETADDFVMYYVDGNILTLVTNVYKIDFDMDIEKPIAKNLLGIDVCGTLPAPRFVRVLHYDNCLCFCPYAIDRIPILDLATYEVKYSDISIEKKVYFAVLMIEDTIVWLPQKLINPIICYNVTMGRFVSHNCYRNGLDDTYGVAVVTSQQNVLLIPASGNKILNLSTSTWKIEVFDTLNCEIGERNVAYYRSTKISCTSSIVTSSNDNIPCLFFDGCNLKKWELGERTDELQVFLDIILHSS